MAVFYEPLEQDRCDEVRSGVSRDGRQARRESTEAILKSWTAIMPESNSDEWNWRGHLHIAFLSLQT